MLEGPCSGSIRHLILSKRALSQAEVLTMDQALLSHEWRSYFAEFGPVIFNARKSDQRPQRARGKAGAAARVVATLSLEEVIARVDPILFGSVNGSLSWHKLHSKYMYIYRDPVSCRPRIQGDPGPLCIHACNIVLRLGALMCHFCGWLQYMLSVDRWLLCLHAYCILVF